MKYYDLGWMCLCLPEFASLKVRLLKVSHETRQQLTGSDRLLRQKIEFAGTDIALVQRYETLRPQFSTRPLRYSQELKELSIAGSLESLGNVRKN
jgi:hypothetical protein